MRTPKHDLKRLRAAWRASEADVQERSTACFRVSNKDDETAKLYVYDIIGGWDSDASEFVQAVHAIKASRIEMHVNSPGGFVFDAVSMFEAVKGHKAHVVTNIDGIAASAASFLALAGDEVRIAKAGRMMIHDAQGVGIGSPADLREYADLLDVVSDDIAGYYVDRAGGTVKSWRAAMTATTWYSASEAVEAGLADSVTREQSKKSEPENRASQLIRARARVALRGVK